MTRLTFALLTLLVSPFWMLVLALSACAPKDPDYFGVCVRGYGPTCSYENQGGIKKKVTDCC